MEPFSFLIAGLFAIGMAVAFWSADPHSPTSRALSLFFALMGVTQLAMIFTGPSSPGASISDAWMRFFSIAEIAIVVTGFEWGLRIGRMQVSAEALEGPERLVRIAQGLVCLYGILGIAFPHLRLDVWNVAPSVQLLSRPAYYLFAVPFGLSCVIGASLVVRLARAGLDT